MGDVMTKLKTENKFEILYSDYQNCLDVLDFDR